MEQMQMGYSIQTHKTTAGKFIAKVNTGSYGRGYAVYTTNEKATAGEAYQDAIDWRTKQAAANAVKKAEKNSAQMTCQCCAGKYLANTGKMAHHGYQRPGNGWQTASCAGAREVPFEVSRDALGDMIRNLEAQAANMIKYRNEVAAEAAPIHRTYDDYSKPKATVYPYKRPTVSFDITRHNFEDIKKDRNRGLYGNFDDLLASELKSRDYQIKSIQEYIVESKKRYASWSQTHKWNRALKEWKTI